MSAYRVAPGRAAFHGRCDRARIAVELATGTET